MAKTSENFPALSKNRRNATAFRIAVMRYSLIAKSYVGCTSVHPPPLPPAVVACVCINKTAARTRGKKISRSIFEKWWKRVEILRAVEGSSKRNAFRLAVMRDAKSHVLCCILLSAWNTVILSWIYLLHERYLICRIYIFLFIYNT